MTVRNLDGLFKPRSVALIGASDEEGSIGRVVARNLLGAGFRGPIMPVNPKHRAIGGVLAYPDVASLPVAPDLGVIATPPETVPGLVAELGRRGARAAVVITAGLSGEGRGAELRQAMLEAARPHLLRVLGPNCLGVMVPASGLNASFAHIHARTGRLAFLAQSGAILTAVLDWATSRGIGFSHLVSLGDMADVDFGDLLDYLTFDPGTRAILLYVEAITHARKFMSAARAAARSKPVIVVKAGREAEGARAALSHTGALAGADEVYEAAFARAGMLRVYALEELFAAVETLALAGPSDGDRLAILTNGGGLGVLAADALIEAGGRLAPLGAETMRRLDAALPPIWSHANPVDIVGDAPGERYASALEALLDDRDVDAVLVLNCPTAVASSTEAAEAVIRAAGARKGKVLTSWLGDGAAAPGRRLFAEARIPTYETPHLAVRGFVHMVRYRRSRELLMQTPPSVLEQPVDTGAARRVIERALAETRAWLTEAEAKEVLTAYGIPVIDSRGAATPEEAARAAEALDGPVALKILSPDITHKSDVGGVRLDLATPEAVRDAAEEILARVSELRPEARVSGFTVQPMAGGPGAHELIVGAVEDPLFGPVILFGAGGTAVEELDDKALALPPLNLHLARELMGRTRIHRLLRGYRDRPPAALDAVAVTLLQISQLVTDVAEIAELDINPLLADARGVLAVDARIRVAPAARPGPARLAIRPYPKALEETVTLEGAGLTVLLRPVRPEDEPALQEGFRKLTPEDVRMRFFAPMKALDHPLAARLSQIDYDREMALVAAEHGPAGRAQIFGVVRLAADPDNERAEYAITVRSDLQGKGLGHLLMARIIDYARARGIGEIYGHVLEENEPMLALCREFGFTFNRLPEEPGIVEVRLRLAPAAGEAA